MSPATFLRRRWPRFIAFGSLQLSGWTLAFCGDASIRPLGLLIISVVSFCSLARAEWKHSVSWGKGVLIIAANVLLLGALIIWVQIGGRANGQATWSVLSHPAVFLAGALLFLMANAKAAFRSPAAARESVQTSVHASK